MDRAEITKEKGETLIFTIFGFTGDLSSRKIIPSLWNLFIENKLPKNFNVIGFSRRELSKEDLRELIENSLDKFLVKNRELKKFERLEKLDDFVNNFSYVSGNFNEESDFRKLKEKILTLEEGCVSKSNKLFYLSTHPNLFETIFKNLSIVELNNVDKEQNGGWSRILVEKPFGFDLESSKDLEKTITTYFNEEQIYRIDHYLFKEPVREIQNLRFARRKFEDLLNNNAVEKIEIKLHETIGVENRGGFYDKIGALRDVGQNHLISILALLTMEINGPRDCVAVQKNRARAVSDLKKLAKQEVSIKTKRAQYSDYKKIKGVGAESQTETYFLIKTEIENERWKNVPVYLEGGKKMQNVTKELVVTFKESANLDEIPNEFFTPKIFKDGNKITFRLENDLQYIEEYSKIIEAGISGQKEFFLIEEEIEAAWIFVDPIIEGWTQNAADLLIYKQGTNPEIKI